MIDTSFWGRTFGGAMLATTLFGCGSSAAPEGTGTTSEAWSGPYVWTSNWTQLQADVNIGGRVYGFGTWCPNGGCVQTDGTDWTTHIAVNNGKIFVSGWEDPTGQTENDALWYSTGISGGVEHFATDPGVGLDFLAVASDNGALWGLAGGSGGADSGMGIWKAADDYGFSPMLGCAFAISVAFNNDVLAIGCEHKLWEGDGVHWHLEYADNGQTLWKRIAVDAQNGDLWGVDVNGVIHHRYYYAPRDDFYWETVTAGLPSGSVPYQIAAWGGTAWVIAVNGPPSALDSRGATGPVFTGFSNGGWQQWGTLQPNNLTVDVATGQPWAIDHPGMVWYLPRRPLP
jgi:hypothetical protein